MSTTEKPSTQLTSTTHSPTFTYGLLKNEPTTKSSIRNYVDDIQTTPQITSTERPKLKYEYDLLQESPTKSVDFNSNSQYVLIWSYEDTPKYSFSAVDDNQDSPKLKYTYRILEDAKYCLNFCAENNISFNFYFSSSHLQKSFLYRFIFPQFL